MFWLPYWKGWLGMFDFRIIPCVDGTDIIDTNLKTPYESLTPSQMVDYVETSKQITYMERMEKREQKKKQKMGGNLFYRLICKFGLG